jgi:hypothetical protein
MAQARTPAGSATGGGSGEQAGGDSTTLNAPQDLTWDDINSGHNVGTRIVSYQISAAAVASSDFTWGFMAEDKGIIVGIGYSNGGVAMSGSVGWELSFVNVTQSDAVMAYFGFGSGTEAAKADDTLAALAADTYGEILNLSNVANANRFNKGDLITVTADRDGTTGVGVFTLFVSYEAQGHV